MSLKDYRRKRNFKQTPEPAGTPVAKRAPKRAKAAPLRFVVQRHHATRPHFDLRLELGGTYKSWAVPKGPSLNPLDQRLAVQVEDHPLEYGKFEGVIPSGNYGAGSVIVWDRGTFEAPRGGDEAALREGWAKGDLKFVLHGQKLAGEFALVRLRGKKEKNLWLLIKKRDFAAQYRPYTPDDVSVQSKRTIADVAARPSRTWTRDKGSRPAPRAGAEKKTAPTSAARSAIARALPAGKSARAAKAPMPRGLRPQRAVRAGGAPGEGDWVFEVPSGGRRAIVEIDAGRAKFYSRARLSLDAPYAALARALGRLAPTAVLDGDVVGVGEAAVFVADDVLYLRGRDLRGEPFSDRRAVLEGISAVGAAAEKWRLAPIEATLAAASAKAQRAGLDHVIAKRADSRYAPGISKDWRQLPVAASAKASRGRATAPAEDLPPRTNVDKIYWPKEKITKGDLLDYYVMIAPTILPHLRDRPESLHRQPDGLKNDGFFQKDNVGYVPKRVATTRVYSASSRKTINYLLCQDAWSLLYLANLGCIELNPWISRVGSLEQPDFAVIDLDPDDNAFSEVIEVALEVRRTLSASGAEGFGNTSGATGLHIYVPVGARYDYDATRAFVEDLCRVVHARFPQNTSLERNPARRQGRIYLDFLQNRRGQTMAAPYCVRPRPGATVSTPLRWTEVKKGLDPSQFTVRTVPTRVRRLGDVWSEILAHPVDLAKAHGRLARWLGDLNAPPKKR